jgi:hypothetical protein
MKANFLKLNKAIEGNSLIMPHLTAAAPPNFSIQGCSVEEQTFGAVLNNSMADYLDMIANSCKKLPFTATPFPPNPMTPIPAYPGGMALGPNDMVVPIRFPAGTANISFDKIIEIAAYKVAITFTNNSSTGSFNVDYFYLDANGNLQNSYSRSITVTPGVQANGVMEFVTFPALPATKTQFFATNNCLQFGNANSSGFLRPDKIGIIQGLSAGGIGDSINYAVLNPSLDKSYIYTVVVVLRNLLAVTPSVPQVTISPYYNTPDAAKTLINLAMKAVGLTPASEVKSTENAQDAATK